MRFRPYNVNHLRIEVASQLTEKQLLRGREYGGRKRGGVPQAEGQEERIAKYAAIIEAGGRLFTNTPVGHDDRA